MVHFAEIFKTSRLKRTYLILKQLLSWMALVSNRRVIVRHYARNLAQYRVLLSKYPAVKQKGGGGRIAQIHPAISH